MNQIENSQEENFKDEISADKKTERGITLKDLAKFVLLTLIIVVPIRVFIAQPFLVSGSSMEPTFEDKEYLIVDKLSYRVENPQRGDVVIFRFPGDTDKFLIKRIIGLPGETVEVRNGKTHIKNESYPDGFVLGEPYALSNLPLITMTVTLKDDYYFVMGDNREQSADSRIWGPLNRSFIVGRPFIRLYPFNEMAMFPGQAHYEY
ncbi:MAG: signal peptidase I [bacterium]|nr:signal peptidase I [bacterium]